MPLALCLSLGGSPKTAIGQTRFPADSVVLTSMRGLVAEGQVTGLVVGLVESDGTRRVLTAGSSGRAGVDLNGETIFEIGSITKTITGILLADMVRTREVSLGDPVATLLSPGSSVPARNGKQISLLDLTTHHSGFPGQIDLPQDSDNPWAAFTVASMYEWLSRFQPTRDPGAAFEYSNVGTGLLGHALALRAGKPYEALITERVLTPLGLSSTSITLTPAMLARVARAHDAFGDSTSMWDIPAIAGAGALRSTANDMLTFAAGNLEAASAVAPTGIHASLKDALAPRRAIKNEKGKVGRDSVGFNWILNASPASRRLIWHNGGTGGHSAVLILDPAGKKAVVVLTNTGDAHSVIQPLAFNLVDSSVALPKPRLGPFVAIAYRTGGIAEAVARYRSAGSANHRFNANETDLNRLGYWLLRKRQNVADAIAIFRLNVETYRDNPDVHDSLGEALAISGQMKEAHASFARAVALAEQQKSDDVGYYRKNLERAAQALAQGVR